MSPVWQSAANKFLRRASYPREGGNRTVPKRSKRGNATTSRTPRRSMEIRPDRAWTDIVISNVNTETWIKYPVGRLMRRLVRRRRACRTVLPKFAFASDYSEMAYEENTWEPIRPLRRIFADRRPVWNPCSRRACSRYSGFSMGEIRQQACRLHGAVAQATFCRKGTTDLWTKAYEFTSVHAARLGATVLRVARPQGRAGVRETAAKAAR